MLGCYYMSSSMALARLRPRVFGRRSGKLLYHWLPFSVALALPRGLEFVPVGLRAALARLPIPARRFAPPARSWLFSASRHPFMLTKAANAPFGHSFDGRHNGSYLTTATELAQGSIVSLLLVGNYRAIFLALFALGVLTLFYS